MINGLASTLLVLSILLSPSSFSKEFYQYLATDFGGSKFQMLNHPFDDVKVAKVVTENDGTLTIFGQYQDTQPNVYNGGFLTKQAANGSIDISFGINGYLTLEQRDRLIDAWPIDYYPLKNGSFYIVHRYYKSIGAQHLIAISKHNKNGTLDSTYANQGIADYPELANPFSFKPRVTIGNNGELYFGSISVDEEAKIYLIRLTAEGKIDDSFGVAGFKYFNLSNHFSFDGEAERIESDFSMLKMDEDILLMFSPSDIRSATCCILVKLKSDGTEDVTFNSAEPLRIERLDYAGNPRLLVDGQSLIILQTGSIDSIYDPDGVIISKVTAEGSIEQSFAGGGLKYHSNAYLFPDYSFSHESIVDAWINSQGHLEVVTQVYVYNDLVYTTFDLSTGAIFQSPTITVSDNIYFNPNFVFETASGELVAVTSRFGKVNGLFTQINKGESAEYARRSNGTFLSGYIDSGDSFVLDNQDNVIVAGYSEDDYLTIEKLDSSGQKKHDFGENGKIKLCETFNEVSCAFGIPFDIISTSDNSIIVAATYEQGFIGNKLILASSLAKFNDDGQIDTTFADGGLLNFTTSLVGHTGALQIRSIELAQDNMIFAAGFANFEGNVKGFVFKIMPNGQLDTTFGDQGSIILSSSDSKHIVKDMGINNAGEIFVAGQIETDTSINSVVTKYRSNGSLDNSFGINGQTSVDLASPVFVESLHIDDNSDIYLGVNTASTADTHNYIPKPYIFKYSPDGEPIDSFGNGGNVHVNWQTGKGAKGNSIRSLTTDSLNRVYVSGVANRDMSSYSFGIEADIGIAVFDQNGIPDNNFTPSGTLVLNFTDSYSKQVLVNSSNEIYLLGDAQDDSDTIGFVSKLAAIPPPQAPTSGDSPALSGNESSSGGGTFGYIIIFLVAILFRRVHFSC
tara:strand:+ start:5707 stop:8427 length:2721 start_codon:yes stop_codon:yes gene_type:complete